MWSPDRRVFLLGAILAGACGFRPVHGPGGAARNWAGRIEVAAPSDRDSFDLTRQLEERLGRSPAPRYSLGFRLNVEEDSLGVTPAGEITHYNVLGTVDFGLTDSETGTDLISGSVTSFTSYAATGDTVSTLASRRDAYRRLMTILADGITGRILAAPEGGTS